MPKIIALLFVGFVLAACGDSATCTTNDCISINVGGTVIQVAAGDNHTCAQLTTRALRCWGYGDRLGYGNLITIGDNESPASAGDQGQRRCAGIYLQLRTGEPDLEHVRCA